MSEESEKKDLIKVSIVLGAVAFVVVIVVIVGIRISDGLMNTSRLSSAMQTMKSVSTAINACQISGLAYYPPDNATNPQNAPCPETGKYATLGGNTTKDCIYNTSFVSTVSGGVAERGAIQAGCQCTGTTIGSCKSVFQCDFATTGKCIGKGATN